VVLNAPSSFELYTQDLYWNTPLCGQTLDETRARRPQVSYDWFANQNLCRRVMLFVGSDDGQLHAFDGRHLPRHRLQAAAAGGRRARELPR